MQFARAKAMFLGLVLAVVIKASSLASAGDLPKFEATTVDGESFKFADIIGKKVIVIDFWATYCIQCRPWMDNLERLHKQYRDKGVVVVAVSVDSPQNVSKIKPFVQTRQYTMPIVLDTDTAISRVLKPVPGLPFTLLINRAGEIVYQHEGYKKGEEKTLEEKIVALLEPGQKPAEPPTQPGLPVAPPDGTAPKQ